jgi:hypothetical protein
MGSPRCDCRGESQRAGDTNPVARRLHVFASWGDHFLMLTTKNPIRCQIPPQQGAAVRVVLSFGADLIPILNLDAALDVVTVWNSFFEFVFSTLRHLCVTFCEA